jgi:hypothetical protein
VKVRDEADLRNFPLWLRLQPISSESNGN